MTLPLDRRIGHHRDEESHEAYGGLQQHRRFDRHRRIGQYETARQPAPAGLQQRPLVQSRANDRMVRTCCR